MAARKQKTHRRAKNDRLKGTIPAEQNSCSPMAWKARLGVQIAISGLLLCGALFVLMCHNYRAEEKHWAHNLVGLILGYWLKK
jgi:hypothetical protein